MSNTQRETVPRYHAADLDLGELITVLWRRKWVVSSITFLCLLIALGYAFMATEWYRAEVILAPSDSMSKPSIGGQLSGILSLTSRDFDSTSSAEAMAVLESRELARQFISDLDLLPVFFRKEWDPAAKTWQESDPLKWPDVRDAVDLFHKHILSVNKDRETSLVTLTITWIDPDVAADWAKNLVERVNSKMRARALEEAKLNISFLTDKLAATNVVALQQSISELLESEMQKMMVAQGNQEFSFRVIDPAESPKYRSRPNRVLIAVVGLLLGIVVGVFVVLILHAGNALRRKVESDAT